MEKIPELAWLDGLVKIYLHGWDRIKWKGRLVDRVKEEEFCHVLDGPMPRLRGQATAVPYKEVWDAARSNLLFVPEDLL